MKPPPERGEDPETPTISVSKGGRLGQEVTCKTPGDNPLRSKLRLKPVGHRKRWRLRDVIPENRLCTHAMRQFGNDAGRCALAQDQPRPQRAEPPLQRSERLGKPPSGGAAKRTGARRTGFLAVEDVEADDWRPGSRGGMQRGMIGETKIFAKPDDAGGGELVAAIGSRLRTQTSPALSAAVGLVITDWITPRA